MSPYRWNKTEMARGLNVVAVSWYGAGMGVAVYRLIGVDVIRQVEGEWVGRVFGLVDDIRQIEGGGRDIGCISL